MSANKRFLLTGALLFVVGDLAPASAGPMQTPNGRTPNFIVRSPAAPSVSSAVNNVNRPSHPAKVTVPDIKLGTGRAK